VLSAVGRRLPPKVPVPEQARLPVAPSREQPFEVEPRGSRCPPPRNRPDDVDHGGAPASRLNVVAVVVMLPPFTATSPANVWFRHWSPSSGGGEVVRAESAEEVDAARDLAPRDLDAVGHARVRAVDLQAVRDQGRTRGRRVVVCADREGVDFVLGERATQPVGVSGPTYWVWAIVDWCFTKRRSAPTSFPPPSPRIVQGQGEHVDEYCCLQVAGGGPLGQVGAQHRCWSWPAGSRNALVGHDIRACSGVVELMPTLPEESMTRRGVSGSWTAESEPVAVARIGADRTSR